MVAQDLTKFTVVLVILGLVLAIAIFRPRILPAEAVVSTRPATEVDGGTVLRARQGESESVSVENLLPREAELERRTGELDQREIKLDQRQYELDRRQAELDVRQHELDQGQGELDEREAKLEGRAASLQAWEEGLGEAEAHLRARGTALAEREQRLQGFLRWSVVAVVVSGLLGVPSVLLLIAMMRQGRGIPDTAVRQTQPSQAHDEREQVAREDRLVTVAPASIYGNDGRGKQNVAVAHRKGVIQTVR